MPLVVLFKSESDGPDKFVEALEKKKFDVRSISCLSFQFKNLQSLRPKLEDHQKFEGLLLTSQRSVNAVYKAVEDNKDIINDWKDKLNYCVGESTSNLAKTSLGLATKGEQTGNAANLSKLVIENHKAKENLKPFLFPAGNLKQDTMEEALSKHAIQVECLEVYETVPHENLQSSIAEIKTLKPDFFVYFSPSGVKFSLPLLKEETIELQDIKIIAIGPSTKKSLEDNNLQCFRVCSKPSPESLLDALTG